MVDVAGVDARGPQDVPRVPRRGERRNAVYPPLTGPAADTGERKPLEQPSSDTRRLSDTGNSQFVVAKVSLHPANE